jgi:hypothetical protein
MLKKTVAVVVLVSSLSGVASGTAHAAESTRTLPQFDTNDIIDAICAAAGGLGVLDSLLGNGICAHP